MFGCIDGFNNCKTSGGRGMLTKLFNFIYSVKVSNFRITAAVFVGSVPGRQCMHVHMVSD